MLVHIDIKKAAKTLSTFVTAQKDTPSHSDCLEFLAGICGFANYRALAASNDTPSPVSPISVIKNERSLEDDAYVIHRSSIVDWQLADNPGISLDEVPASNRTNFDIIIEKYGHQYRVLLKPEGINLDNFDGIPVLDMLLEINEGVPCIHLTNDPSDVQLLTVFSNAKGLIVRPDDGEWMRASQSHVPKSLQAAAKEVTNTNDLSAIYVCVLDTKEKYANVLAVSPLLNAKELLTNTGELEMSVKKFKSEEGVDGYSFSIDLTNKVTASKESYEIRVTGRKYLENVNELSLQGLIVDLTKVVSFFCSNDIPFKNLKNLICWTLLTENPRRLLDNYIDILKDTNTRSASNKLQEILELAKLSP